jgi:hypothetical protein
VRQFENVSKSDMNSVVARSLHIRTTLLIDVNTRKMCSGRTTTERPLSREPYNRNFNCIDRSYSVDFVSYHE